MFRTPMTLSTSQRVLTSVVALIVVVAFGGALASTGPAVPVSAGLLVVGVSLALAWAMSPRALAVEGGELRVERRAWPSLRVPLSDITSAAPLKSLGGGVLRLFGVGGFFGSYGLFRSTGLGRFRLYATRSGTSVLVRRNDDQLPLVLTPDDVDGAIAAIDPRPLA